MAHFFAVWSPIFSTVQLNLLSRSLLCEGKSLHGAYCCLRCLQERSGKHWTRNSGKPTERSSLINCNKTTLLKADHLFRGRDGPVSHKILSVARIPGEKGALASHNTHYWNKSVLIGSRSSATKQTFLHSAIKWAPRKLTTYIHLSNCQEKKKISIFLVIVFFLWVSKTFYSIKLVSGHSLP